MGLVLEFPISDEWHTSQSQNFSIIHDITAVLDALAVIIDEADYLIPRQRSPGNIQIKGKKDNAQDKGRFKF